MFSLCCVGSDDGQSNPHLQPLDGHDDDFEFGGVIEADDVGMDQAGDILISPKKRFARFLIPLHGLKQVLDCFKPVGGLGFFTR